MSDTQHEQYLKDDAAAAEILREFLGDHAVRPPVYGNKRAITVKISSVALDGLRQIALKMGYTFNGQGNVSLLIESIGTGTLSVEQRSK